LSVTAESDFRHYGIRKTLVNAFREVKEIAKTECRPGIKGAYR